MTDEPRGRDIRQERVTAGVTQTDLAIELQMVRPALSLIENERAPLNAEFVAQYRAAIARVVERNAERAESVA